jgi:hypothetical protein
MNQQLCFNATELFSVNLVPNLYPLDITFELKPYSNEEIFKNSGVFTLFYRGELIYIGYSDNKDDIRTSRFVRQLQTVTMRGLHVQFNQKSKNTIRESVNLRNDFNEDILSSENQLDFMTSKNRILFADKHWDEFSRLDNSILQHFEFVWCVITGNKNRSEFATNLKRNYKPRCNQEFDNYGDLNLEIINF